MSKKYLHKINKHKNKMREKNPFAKAMIHSKDTELAWLNEVTELSRMGLVSINYKQYKDGASTPQILSLNEKGKQELNKIDKKYGIFPMSKGHMKTKEFYSKMNNVSKLINENKIKLKMKFFEGKNNDK